MSLTSDRRRAILATTICSISFLLTADAAAGDAVAEPDLVRRFLQSKPIEAELRVAELRQVAAVAPASLPNPELQYRHDEARGFQRPRRPGCGARLLAPRVGSSWLGLCALCAGI